MYADVAAPGSPGSFSLEDTIQARRDEPGTCCYRRTTPCPGGRPLWDAGMPVLAPSVPRGDWALEPAMVAAAVDASIDDVARARLVAHWLVEAAAEHASVASFSRFALQLLALGAPADLVAATHRAALDEIEHARLCYAIAARLSGEPVGPGPLRLPAEIVPTDIASVARETLRDGCFGESVAARCAGEAAAVTRDPEIARALSRIAADEEAHAELAFRALGWMLVVDPKAVRREIEEFLRQLVPTPGASETPNPHPSDAAYGVLDAATRAAVEREVRAELVRPCLRALLEHGASAPGAPAPRAVAERSPLLLLA